MPSTTLTAYIDEVTKLLGNDLNNDYCDQILLKFDSKKVKKNKLTIKI